MNPTRSIRGILFAAALLFSAGLIGGTYWAVVRLYEHSVREDAVRDASAFADMTFAAMFELMSTGWSRQQLERFIGSMQASVSQSAYQIDIYRGAKVSALFGSIAEKPADDAVASALAEGATRRFADGDEVRFLRPLRAEAVCLRCHVNAAIGDVLGVIDVRQRVAPLIAANTKKFMWAFAPVVPVALLMTAMMVLFIRRRLGTAIGAFEADIRRVNKVSDLKRLEGKSLDFGFEELAGVSREVRQLTERLRNVAVDKDMLEFEIKLLEKFILTSDVIKDWREYVCRLVAEIDTVVPTFALFSIFKVGSDTFDLEVFWRFAPSDVTKQTLERGIHAALQENHYFAGGYALRLEHNVADSARKLGEISPADLAVQLKSLLVDAPKIGGIVGIGMQSTQDADPMQMLVIESVLATLLNVVGSVKAIDKYTKDLEYYATRDPLTNLYNQRVFWELLDNEITRSARHGNKFALLVIDADNFKSVNDSYGHAFGDTFLQSVTQRIRAAIRDDDLLSRYGGDEFTVILPETDLIGAEGVARRILDMTAALVMDAPNGGKVTGSLSIGMSVYPDHAAAPKDLFLFADNMMYRAKADGKARVAVPTDQDMIEIFRSMGEKSMLILNAVERRGVIPYFQPIINVSSGQVEAIEVLSRIRLDDGTLMIADEYVAIAEKMGVMHKLDYILMASALAAAEAAGYEGLLFLNMSPRALVLNDFVAETRRIAEQTRIPRDRIVFEITERETIKNMALLERFIGTLRAEGFKLAIDDFGSGFSSFHYVKRFHIDFLKIEGDFVLGMKNSDKDRALVRSIVTLGRDLGIRTVAEYVEDDAVLREVATQGIDLAQGFHIRRPCLSIAEAMSAGLPPRGV